MSYIKVDTNNHDSRKCIRFDTTYTKCELATSKLNKLPHILGLYDSIEALVLTIDEPPANWKITRPHDTIKHLWLKARKKYCNRPEVLPENFWLMFPNLETIITDEVFCPVANLDALQNLNTFLLTWGPSKIKKTDTKIQDIVQILTNMNPLTDIKISSTQECHIPDELFQNNTNLQFVKFARNAKTDNIPSILNCRELKRLTLNINLVENQYILELSNIEEFEIDNIGSEPIPDEFFAKPLFMTCKTKRGNLNCDDSTLINSRGENYRKYNESLRDSAVPAKPWCDIHRKLGNGNFVIYDS